MNTGILITFGIVAVWALLMGFCIGVLVESKNLRKWFDKELELIEKRYKRKYEMDGDSDDEP